MPFPEWFDEKFGTHTIELYQDEIRHTPRQLETLKVFLGPPGEKPVLDICCGWGRHALPLARMGYTVVGLDGSSYFLEKARRELNDQKKTRLSLLRGDMCILPFQTSSFAAAIQMYTSFGYGTDPEDDRRVLNELNRILQPRGTYLLDLINWTLARKAFDGRYEESYPNFDLVEQCRIDPQRNFLKVKRALLYRDGREPHLYNFEIRMFDRMSLTRLLEETGFEVLDVWGDFDCSPYRPWKSYRMITVCRKRSD